MIAAVAVTVRETARMPLVRAGGDEEISEKKGERKMRVFFREANVPTSHPRAAKCESSPRHRDRMLTTRVRREIYVYFTILYITVFQIELLVLEKGVALIKYIELNISRIMRK